MDIGIRGDEGTQEYGAHAAAPTRRRSRTDISALLKSNVVTAVVLAWIAVFAFSLRITNVNWDQGQHLHPDERFQMIVMDGVRAPSSVGEYFDTAKSPLNPYQKQGSYVYGTFPLFLNKTVAEWMDRDQDGSTHASAAPVRWTMEHVLRVPLEKDGQYTFDGSYNSEKIGRVLSALFDVFTILLVFELGRVLYSRRVGLLAAALMSVSVLNIQYAHFFGAETFLVFFITATIYFSVRISKYGNAWNYGFSGLAFGMALACKLSALPVILIPALAVIIRMWPELERSYQWLVGRPVPWRGPPADGEPRVPNVDWWRIVGPALGGLGVLVVTGIVFRIAQPYAFTGPGFFDVIHIDLARKDVFSTSALLHLEFLKPTHYFAFSEQYRKDIDGLINLQKGADFPPNIQWIDRPKYIFPLKGMALWGMGLPLFLAAVGGMIYAGFRIVRRRDFTAFLLLFWTLFEFWFVARGFTPTIRYFLPIYPTMAILAALGLVRLWDYAVSDEARHAIPERFSQAREYVRPALRGVAIIAVAGAFVWALAFINVYRQDISRVQASVWINQNIPPGSSVSSNEWDDGLPLHLPGLQDNYKHVQLKPYAQDNEQKVQELVAGLDATDYVIESSNRVYATIPRIPARFPNTVLYYKYLFDGTLGFEKVAEFHNYPGIFGIQIPDQSSEESFTVYDHPKVTIWKKTDAYSHDRTIQLLQIEKADAAVAVPPKDAQQNALYFKPDVLETERDGGTWSKLFHPGNVVNAHPLFFWLLAMELSAFALVPLALMIFRGLPDRGFLLTKPLGILALAYAAYAPAAFGLMKYTRGEIALGLAALVVFGLATAYRWREEIRAWVRERWRSVAFSEALFLLVFVGAYWVRLQNPDLWHPVRGGEKPMDFAYFNGVIRTTDLTQGPIDPWHSGGYLNYYWFGQFIAATVTKLTGVVPEVAYNLVVPMFFALAAAATFSVAYNLAEATRRLMKRRPGGKPISARGPFVAGLGAIFLVLLSGNLKAVQTLEINLSKISPWHSDVPVLGGIIVIIGGFKEVIFGDATLRQVAYSYDWWDPSRAIDVVHQGEVTPITEFPFWTFLFADLHAHLMAIPFAMTAVGVALGVVLNFTRLNPLTLSPDLMERKRTRQIASWVMVITLGLIVGALRWINSWDFPVFLLLSATAIAIAERAKEGRWTWWWAFMSGVKIIVMGLLTVLFFAPFSHNYNMFYRGFHESDQTTALSDYMSHFGILIILMSGFAMFALQRAIARDRVLHRLVFGRRSKKRSAVDTAPVIIAAILGAGALLAWTSAERGAVIAFAIIGLVAICVAAFRELRSHSPMAPVLLFVYAMIAMGLGLSGGVEILTLDGDIGRMNTVFKFYLHVWLLWGVAAAYGTWYVFGVMRPQDAFLRRAGELNLSFVRATRYAFGAVVVFLLALSLVYPYFGTRGRIHDRFNPAQGTGNNGMAYMETAEFRDGPNESGKGGDHVLKYDRDGIDWLRANVEGTPPIIEGMAPLYHVGSRVSIYTGLPTVLGWDWHQIQQRARFGATVQKRQTDVNNFYTTTDIQLARTILARYDVQYVIVGDVEQNYYPADGMRKFESGLGGSLELVYENPGMRIYHVIPRDELPAAANVVAP